MKRAVIRYFFRKLFPSGDIQRINLLPHFAKWIDTSSSECVFTLEQKKNFKRPHLMPYPWYIELACTDKCSSKEAALKASCEQQVLEESDSGAGVEADIEILDDGLIERQRSRVAAKMAKLQAKEKEKEDKKLAMEQKRKERRKETKERQQLGMKVKKLGLKKVLEDEGIFLSGSTKPTSTMPALATPGSAHTYSICTFDKNEDSSEVLVINSSPDDILAQSEKLPEGQ